MKLLQFCNIFTKDATTFTRQQRHEIIKYVRTRMPIYLSQVHQLLQNVHLVLGSLSPDDRNDLVSYLVPEITAALEVLTAAVSEIKRSLEAVCKDLKSSQQEQQQQQKLHESTVHAGRTQQQQQQPARSSTTGNSRAGERTHLNRSHHARSSSSSSSGGGGGGGGTSSTSVPSRLGHSPSESDLKFFLYMYEVKKMRDIYGRVTNALEVLLHKKGTFNEMNLLHQHQTVRRNLEQLALEVPAAIGQLEELCDTIDEKIGWKEFKFCFKFLTSQVVRRSLIGNVFATLLICLCSALIAERHRVEAAGAQGRPERRNVLRRCSGVPTQILPALTNAPLWCVCAPSSLFADLDAGAEGTVHLCAGRARPAGQAERRAGPAARVCRPAQCGTVERAAAARVRHRQDEPGAEPVRVADRVPQQPVEECAQAAALGPAGGHGV